MANAKLDALLSACGTMRESLDGCGPIAEPNSKLPKTPDEVREVLARAGQANPLLSMMGLSPDVDDNDLAPALGALSELERLDSNPDRPLFGREVHHELANFARHVAVDGRFIDSWRDDPNQAASELGMAFSPELERRLSFASRTGLDPVIPRIGPLVPPRPWPTTGPWPRTGPSPTPVPGPDDGPVFPRQPPQPPRDPDDPPPRGPDDGPVFPRQARQPPRDPDDPPPRGPDDGPVFPRQPPQPPRDPDDPPPPRGPDDGPVWPPRTPGDPPGVVPFPGTDPGLNPRGNIVSVVITAVVIAGVALRLDVDPGDFEVIDPRAGERL
jgi:hypothetical protein